MQRTLPQPIRAGIGLANAAAERARHIDLTDLATVPVRGLGIIANARERFERTYQSLADRGEQVLARRRNGDGDGATPAPPTIDLGGAQPGATLAHDELPLDDYDHLTLGSLRARLPKLDIVALTQLRDYERVHANRLPVLTMLDNRIAKLTSQ